jgi:hypothetical protein
MGGELGPTAPRLIWRGLREALKQMLESAVACLDQSSRLCDLVVAARSTPLVDRPNRR